MVLAWFPLRHHGILRVTSEVQGQFGETGTVENQICLRKGNFFRGKYGPLLREVRQYFYRNFLKSRNIVSEMHEIGIEF